MQSFSVKGFKKSFKYFDHILDQACKRFYIIDFIYEIRKHYLYITEKFHNF